MLSPEIQYIQPGCIIKLIFIYVRTYMHVIGAGVGGKIAAMAGKCLHGQLKRITGKNQFI